MQAPPSLLLLLPSLLLLLSLLLQARTANSQQPLYLLVPLPLSKLAACNLQLAKWAQRNLSQQGKQLTKWQLCSLPPTLLFLQQQHLQWM
jgi:hypothetical protein